ncbi:MAG: adenosylhomocysteinase [Acidimicrobiia bacterium]|nr:adenosylhomocysteinase [Acidimicrobiia bacterium]
MDYDIKDASLAAEGQLRIDWAARRMPVLAGLVEDATGSKPLAGKTVAGCLHVTAETANLMLALRDLGAEVALCASNPLSTQDDVAAALVASGIPVFAVRGEDSDTYYSHIHSVLDKNPDVTMDDGADLVTVLHKERTDQQVLGSTEETTTGVIRLRAMEQDGVLRFPVVAVNDSATKHLFDNRHGTGQSALDGIMRAANVLYAGRTVVVVGYGDCGLGVASRAAGLGANIIVVEVQPVRALAAAMEGYRVADSLTAAAQGDIFVTVTGGIHAIGAEEINAMKDGAIIANAGHFDVEIDLVALAEMAVAKRRLRENLDEYELADGRRIVVVAEGRLVNLSAAEGHPADVMDMSFANQATAVRWVVENAGQLENKVYRLPEELDDDVARIKLEAMGFTLQELTPEQAEYLASWQHGT